MRLARFVVSTVVLAVRFGATFAGNVRGASFAKTSAMGALRDWAAFLVYVGERAICNSIISKRLEGSSPQWATESLDAYQSVDRY